MNDVVDIELKAFLAKGKAEIIKQIVEKIQDMFEDKFREFIEAHPIEDDGYRHFIFGTNRSPEEEMVTDERYLVINPFFFGAAEVVGVYPVPFRVGQLYYKNVADILDIKCNDNDNYNYKSYYNLFTEDELNIISITVCRYLNLLSKTPSCYWKQSNNQWVLYLKEDE